MVPAYIMAFAIRKAARIAMPTSAQASLKLRQANLAATGSGV